MVYGNPARAGDRPSVAADVTATVNSELGDNRRDFHSCRSSIYVSSCLGKRARTRQRRPLLAARAWIEVEVRLIGAFTESCAIRSLARANNEREDVDKGIYVSNETQTNTPWFARPMYFAREHAVQVSRSCSFPRVTKTRERREGRKKLAVARQGTAPRVRTGSLKIAEENS